MPGWHTSTRCCTEPSIPTADGTTRLDRALLDRDLARSRNQARSMIISGQVSINGRPARRVAEPVRAEDRLEVSDDDASSRGYVSRAALKLLGALDDLELRVCGRALDAGASTGGFTQVLLERGCDEVVAVDVGHGQLDDRIRGDSRVVVWERTNLRDLTLHHVDHRQVDLVVADVSFISLTLLVRPLTSVLSPAGSLLLMVKPQFEVGRDRLGKGGVVRSEQLHRDAVAQVVAAAEEVGWHPQAVVRSRLPGPAGNVEFFVLFRRAEPRCRVDIGSVTGAAYAVAGDRTT
ncbi:TlyA family RNA methyltransferase [Microlunatus panaciterrae]|uniref:23S rRNA (Cytidine1920-2'-O)/16S rRNA (Cytidine1409-2'-O)-methyltransferase n=1 Tax=Microlunatus panaciterrae TaxID=400768 RepID=A0ABS2RNA8_9ACTN|nr:TlyA family RNA methyltransferase [Microlunatus panaciterrae]MBM7800462.1 23S rRNA (cytidine1920-2'-O)/16S rRNA (cytidine1409-2'-O)-methyltransferase [Microlunatus panaciterrae]